MAQSAGEVARYRCVRVAGFDGGLQFDIVVGIETHDDHVVHGFVRGEDRVEQSQQFQAQSACARIIADHYETQIADDIFGACQFPDMFQAGVTAFQDNKSQIIWSTVKCFDYLNEYWADDDWERIFFNDIGIFGYCFTLQTEMI